MKKIRSNIFTFKYSKDMDVKELSDFLYSIDLEEYPKTSIGVTFTVQASWSSHLKKVVTARVSLYIQKGLLDRALEGKRIREAVDEFFADRGFEPSGVEKLSNLYDAR